MPTADLALCRPAGLASLPGLAAAYTTRTGGVSAAPYASLNLGTGTDDDPAAVAENRRRLAAALGFAPDAYALAGQVHGADVETVTAPGYVPNRDGLVTATPGVLLAIKTADCAAVLLADPVARVVGACHAGWRGTVAGVVGRTIDAMAALGADPKRLRAYVSPCIGTARFEVGPEVAAQFDPAFVHTRPDWPRPHVDLKAALVAQLTEAGVPADQVEVEDACTMSEPERFFSHRASGGVTGRMLGVIGLR